MGTADLLCPRLFGPGIGGKAAEFKTNSAVGRSGSAVLSRTRRPRAPQGRVAQPAPVGDFDLALSTFAPPDLAPDETERFDGRNEKDSCIPDQRVNPEQESIDGVGIHMASPLWNEPHLWGLGEGGCSEEEWRWGPSPESL